MSTQISPTIFINQDAVKIEELFLNENWSLVQLYERIYAVNIAGKSLDWIVKVHQAKRFTLQESKNLEKIKNVEGVPKILAMGLSWQLSYLILSKAPGIDLYEYVRINGVFSETEIKPIVKKLLLIVKAIHRYGIVHKDIKPENIVYDKDTGRITLVDFEEKHTDVYQSPEQVTHRPVTYKTDLWSIGVTVYTILCAEMIFINTTEIRGKRIFFPRHWTARFRDFMKNLLERDVTLRYDAEDALLHPWLTSQ